MKDRSKQIIKRGFALGALDAESDTSLLDACFIDSGIADQLISLQSNASIVTGRTGSGKSSLLHYVSKNTNNLPIDPNEISIRYLEFSNIINVLIELGVQLNLFYKYLWRHIIVSKIIQFKYVDKEETKFIAFVDSIKNRIINKKAKKQKSKKDNVRLLRRMG